MSRSRKTLRIATGCIAAGVTLCTFSLPLAAEPSASLPIAHGPTAPVPNVTGTTGPAPIAAGQIGLEGDEETSAEISTTADEVSNGVIVPDAAPQNAATPSSDTAPATVPEPMIEAPPPLPAPPPPVPAPKKKTPPQFPGPKTLPPTGPWKTLFFENDFSYLNNPVHDHLLGEELKDVPFCLFDVPFKVSTGGEIRHRYMNEDNRLRPGGPIQSDNHLIRWRQYVDVKAGDRLRFYVEGIEADSFGGEAPVQQIDVNRWDLQNYFVDGKLFENDWGTHTARYGRQELLFGRQRLVSPLDWANTRRNFQGVRYMVKGDDYKLDLFSVNPVNSATGYQPVAQYDSQFDQPNRGVQFSGGYFTYTGIKNTIIDSYYMYQNTQVDVVNRPDGSRHMLGSRVSHLYPILDECDQECRVWDFDAEGAFQFGKDNGQDVFAGMFTSIVGHSWKQVPWAPRVSGLFYYGSGDRSPTDTRNNTFSVLYPLGHAYWALSDNLVGQNLFDYALQLDLKPTKKTAITGAYHWFELASDGDRAYNVAGVPVGTPYHGRNLGQAVDLYGYYAVNPNLDVQLGYSWFFYGSFIEQTAPRGDATQFYVQTSLRY